MSYLEYYGLKREPFSNAPVSQFYFNSTPHSEALTRLTHAVAHMKGLALLVGDIGTGKTTLARRLLDSLPEAQYEASLLVIIHSGITATWLLKRIAVQLGVKAPADEKLALLGQLYQRLLEIHESGRKAVVLIDEAQMLETRELMEEFRGLLNLELPEHKLITFVFFGLPELENNLRLDPPLHQRVALKIRLQSLPLDATEAYMKHRLRLAGATRMPFSLEAVHAIHRYTGGTPRLINTLCDNCLFEGFLARLPVVTEKLVHSVARDLGLKDYESGGGQSGQGSDGLTGGGRLSTTRSSTASAERPDASSPASSVPTGPTIPTVPTVPTLPTIPSVPTAPMGPFVETLPSVPPVRTVSTGSTGPITPTPPPPPADALERSTPLLAGGGGASRHSDAENTLTSGDLREFERFLARGDKH